MHIPSTLVAEVAPTSALNNGATINELNTMVTVWAPHPLLPLSKNLKRNIIPISRLPTLLAPVPRVPRQLAKEAKQPLTIRTHRPPHRPPALVHHHGRTPPVRAVTPVQPQ